MDPLSITASVITVLELTTKLMKCINTVACATKEQTQLAIEVSNLYGLLTALRFRVEEAKGDEPWFNQLKLLSLRNGPLDQFQHLLEDLVQAISTSNSSAVSRMKTKMTWPINKSKLDGALQQIERLKLLVNCALTNDLFSLTQAIAVNVDNVTKEIDGMTSGVAQLSVHMKRERLEKCADWLRLLDPSLNYNAALEKRYPETGKWLLNDARYRAWKSTSPTFLWLHGSAGCGKTVLSATIVRDLIEYAEQESSRKVAYFYFDFNDVSKQSCEKAIRSLLFQVSLQSAESYQALEQLYLKCDNGQRQPSVDEVQTLLFNALRGSGSTFLVVDALDECPNRQDARAKLLQFIHRLVGIEKHNVHLLATSRREKDIEDNLRGITGHIVDIQSNQVDKDIYLYVAGRLSTDTKLTRWNLKQRQMILETLTAKSHGMFRWVDCQLRSVRQCVKLSSLKKALSELPKDLDETYHRIFDDIESQGHLDDALKALIWLCFSQQSLNLSEMAEVLAIVDVDKVGFEEDDRLPDPRDLATICSSFITINHADQHAGKAGVDIADPYREEKFAGEGWVQHKSSGDQVATIRKRRDFTHYVVRLAHFSVKEFLLSGRCKYHRHFEAFSGREKISLGCFHYLFHAFEHCDAFLPHLDRWEETYIARNAMKEYPLARYAAHEWLLHYPELQKSSETQLDQLVWRLLSDTDGNFTHWHTLYTGGLLSYEFRPPVYYATQFGLESILKKLIDRGDDVNMICGRNSTLLHLAIRSNNPGVAKILIEKGADTEDQHGTYGRILQWIAVKGWDELLQTAMDNKADINAISWWYGTALQAACARGYKNMVSVLCNRGADVDLHAGYYGTALQAAAEAGSKDIVQLLTDLGANIDSACGAYGSPLHAAALSGHRDVVRTLVGKGATVEAAASMTNFAPKVLEARRDAHWMAERLEWSRINPTVVLKNHTALSVACAAGHEEVVKILLASHASPDTVVQEDVCPAVHSASLQETSQILNLLLKVGADVNISGGLFDTALIAAILRRSVPCIKMLLDHGAHINEHTTFGTALCCATTFGYIHIVRILIERGADINVRCIENLERGGYCGSPLQAAIEMGHEDIALLLLSEYGATFHRGVVELEMYLYLACARAEWKLVELLLTRLSSVPAGERDRISTELFEYIGPDTTTGRRIQTWWFELL